MLKRLSSLLLALLLLLSIVPAASALNTSAHTLSAEGLSFFKSHTNFRSTAYSEKGKWYIGYGSSCAQNAYPAGIDEETATALLLEDLKVHESSLQAYLTTNGISLNQHEYDGLLSFTASLGSAWMSGESQIAKYLKAGLSQQQPAAVVDAMAIWCNSDGQVVEAYLQRRIDEARLLLHGDYSGRSAPQYYSLILDKNGGIVENSTRTYAAGAPYGSLPVASRSGHQFDGWFAADGTKITSDMQATAHQRVQARWTADSPLGFSDVLASDWFYPYVYDLTRSGVINGRSPTQFDPTGTLSFGEATKLILLAAGHPEQAATASHWASGYVSYATKLNYLTSAPTNLDTAITRLQIAQLASKTLNLPVPVSTNPFTDTTDASVRSLYEAGIVQGSTVNGKLVFLPKDSIRRSEISAIIWRMERYEPGTVVTPPQPPAPAVPDRSQQFEYKGRWLDIMPNVPKNPYNPELFYKQDGYTHYRSDAYRYETGIDVSVYQGEIDWHQVRDAGIDFAIIRVGGRGWGTEGKIYDDKLFEKNMQGATEAGIKIGVYFFSQAISVEEAREEARYVLDKIKPYKVTYPVAFDWEIVDNKAARTSSVDVPTLTAAANAFCQDIQQAGYHPTVYFNPPCGYLRYDLSKLVQYDFWYAQYYSTPTFYYGFDMWQYSDSGKVPGIAGKVDLNLYFLPK